jgi:hypothetical protein
MQVNTCLGLARAYVALQTQAMRSRKAAAVAASLPLFERATRSAIVMLIVRRLGEDGRWSRAPDGFAQDELPDREAVRARFGGGKYEVIGRDAYRIVARTTFTVDGEPLALAPAPPLPEDRAVTGQRAFATDLGARQAIVYRLLDQGLSCVEVTQRSEIDDDSVREIYLRWLTPDGCQRPTTPEQIAVYQRLRAEQRHAQHRQGWEPSSP